MTSCLQSLLDRYSSAAIYDKSDETGSDASVQLKNTEATSRLQLADILADMKYGNASHATFADRQLICSRQSGKSRFQRLLRSLPLATCQELAKKLYRKGLVTKSDANVISGGYLRAIYVDELGDLVPILNTQSLDPGVIGHGLSVQAEDARNAGQDASNRRTTKVERNRKKSNRTNQKGETKMSRLPHVKGSKRGPKRLAMARKVANAGHKNWHARASMWLDGLNSRGHALYVARWNSPQVNS